MSVRVRFCPSPTGDPHVGLIRTALFNWAYARHTGGTFVFRVEDTDAARDSHESYQALIDALRWLGLEWDEGPEIGGPFGPYRQSERHEIYRSVISRLLESDHCYECFCTTEELDARREEARAQGRPPGYDGHCRSLDASQVEARKAAGDLSVIRLRMPEGDITWPDLIRGDITFQAGQVPDFVLQRANGDPLYTLVNPVDDAAMRITHVLRGEDLLSSTPRQIALYRALMDVGVFEGPVPQFGHLPYVMGEGNKKLSKRDPESSLRMYQKAGYLPEALANYLALLGWSLGGDVEFFSKEEMAAAFTLDRVNPNPARFDLKKCTAINGDWIRHLGHDELAARIAPFLAEHALVCDPPTKDEAQVLAEAVPLVAERLETLGQSVELLRFFFDQNVSWDEQDQERVLGPDSPKVLSSAIQALEAEAEWQAAAIEQALRESLVNELGLKPKVAFGPVRLAITGRRISPPLFESMEILGRDVSMARMMALRDHLTR